MRTLILTALVAAVPLVAQQPQDPCARTAGTGYSDTPVLPGQKWKVHDIDRPRPALVTPGAMAAPVPPPSDAVVLFDGKDLSQWVQRGKRGADRDKLMAPRWKVENGYMEATPGTGGIFTKEKFGDIQLHIEWATPAEVCGTSQWRGNGGVMIMGRYEIQVLDSIDNPTYADGQAGAIYGQWPPLVNASRPRGEWQSFDIVFEAPKFDGEKLVKPAYATVFHNGVMVHHRQEIIGPVAHRKYLLYSPHAAEEPILIQDHDVPVRYRNIWVRRLKGYDQR
ncbi:MAG: DUF1080 domain-containing protein [bacterium]|nr:DUF1080 domain-containing protein [bacterium]